MKLKTYVTVFVATIALFFINVSSSYSQERMTLKIYFTDEETLISHDCSAVIAVPRKIYKTQQTARTALKELFKGPTAAEKKRYKVSSYFSSKSAELLNKIVIRNGTAFVDLKGPLENFGIDNTYSTSCGSAAFLTPIVSTLKQFRSIKHIYFSFNGNYEDFYNTFEMECPEELKECKGTQ